MDYLILFLIIGIAPLVYVIYQWTKEEYEKGKDFNNEF
ncbi:hypothetical protein CCP1ISM_50046 [Azospirillaceae bacterium]